MILRQCHSRGGPIDPQTGAAWNHWDNTSVPITTHTHTPLQYTHNNEKTESKWHWSYRAPRFWPRYIRDEHKFHSYEPTETYTKGRRISEISKRDEVLPLHKRRLKNPVNKWYLGQGVRQPAGQSGTILQPPPDSLATSLRATVSPWELTWPWPNNKTWILDWKPCEFRWKSLQSWLRTKERGKE